MSWIKRLLGIERVSVSDASSPAPAQSSGHKVSTGPDAPLPPFPFPLVAVSGRSAEQEWRRLNANWRKEGASAVVVGDEQNIKMLKDVIDFRPRTPEAILAAAPAISVQDYFRRRREEWGAEGETEFPEGEWPDRSVAPMEFTAHTNILNGTPKKVVYIARIPTSRPWEIAAFLRFGDWNDCPAPEIHVAVMQHWVKEYDIEIYSMAGDVVECLVARPPASRGAALTLAREQFLYCTDIVMQGTESVSVLAATLQDSAVW